MLSGLEGLISIVLAFLVVTVSPGPANIAVATVAMSSGRRKGLIFGLGLSVGLAFWGIIAATGMGAVLQASEYALMALKVCGGLYLIWLAYQSGRSAFSKSKPVEDEGVTGKWFTRGLILNLSNPKAVVAWMAALSVGLGVGDGVSNVAIATLICVVLGFLNYSGYAMAFSYSGAMDGYRKFRRWIDGVVAGLFAVAGLSLLRSAFSRS